MTSIHDGKRIILIIQCFFSVPHQESVESGTDGHDVDIIWHNMLASSDFTTWRKTSRRSIHELLADFTALVQQGYLEVINLSVSKSTFVAIIGCDKNWADLQDRILQATR